MQALKADNQFQEKLGQVRARSNIHINQCDAYCVCHVARPPDYKGGRCFCKKTIQV